LADSFHNSLAFGNEESQGLLAVDILARLAGLNRRQGMPMIRRADENGVYGFVLQQFPIIAEGGTWAAILFLDALLRSRQMGLVHVADGHGIFDNLAEVMISLPANADETDADKVARILPGGGACAIEKNVRSDDTEANCSPPETKEEFAAREGCAF